LLGGDLGVGEVDHDTRRREQLHGGERKRAIAVDFDGARAVVAVCADAQDPALLFSGRAQRQRQRAARESEGFPSHAPGTLTRGQDSPKRPSGPRRERRAAYSTRSFTSAQIWWMSVPMVSSRWLFSFTGRQSRYSLRAARQIPRVLRAEAILSRSPKKIAIGIRIWRKCAL